MKNCIEWNIEKSLIASVANKGMGKNIFTQWWKLAQTFWKALWKKYLLKFKICMPIDPRVPFLEINLKNK